MVIAYLGLGSNLGNRLAYLRGGRDRLTGRGDIVLRRASAVFETAAVGGSADSPAFLNAVLEVATDLDPGALLAACHAVEDAFGRTRPAVWAPRTLDIDLLLYGDRVIDVPGLQVPHPRLHERGFVLTPLSALAPGLLHPILGQTMGSLAAALPPGSAPGPFAASW